MYFVAIVLPEELNQKILIWKNYMKEHYGCSVALKSPAHITLIPPFWMEEELEENLKVDLHEFSALQSSFNIELNNFSSFKPRVIFLEVETNESLQELKDKLEIELLEKKFPIKKDERAFHPHITIANRDLRKKDFAEANDHFQKISYIQEFSASGLSLLRHDGSVWQTETSFPFNC